MRDDLVEKNDVPANVERLSHLIDHLKQQEKSYLRFLQKMLVSVFLLKAFTEYEVEQNNAWVLNVACLLLFMT